jgi:hypothetical protein
VSLEFPNIPTSIATLTAVKMASQVQEFLMTILEQGGPDDVLFQQEEASPHFHNEVTEFLNRKFPEKWIGRGGPITWPPRSPDLTPLHIFLATTLPELAGRIRDAVGTVTLDLLNKAWACRTTHDDLIEYV